MRISAGSSSDSGGAPAVSGDQPSHASVNAARATPARTCQCSRPRASAPSSGSHPASAAAPSSHTASTPTRRAVGDGRVRATKCPVPRRISARSPPASVLRSAPSLRMHATAPPAGLSMMSSVT